MRLRWDPVPADWADGIRAVVPMTRRSRWYAGALAVFAIVLIVLGQTAAGAFGLACAVVVAAIPVVAVRIAFSRDPVAGKTVTAEVSPDAIRMMTADGTAYSDVRLAELTGWAETDRSFVLRVGPSGFHPVPGRAFASTEDIDRFRDLLVTAVGKAG